MLAKLERPDETNKGERSSNVGLLTQFAKGLNLQGVWNTLAHSSEVEHCPDKTGVEGSLPSVPTNYVRVVKR